MPILHWLNKNQAVKTSSQCAYRLLEEVPGLSYGDPDNRNMLIQGDNLEALKALIPFYAGQVKCIYIDPPYNTRSAFSHYDDNLEHSIWLSMMYPRLELLRELLSEEGSIWVSIDDNEAHYLKVMMDEVFGRGNFVASNVWQKRYSRENRESIGDVHEYLFIYVKDQDKFKQYRNRIPLDESQAKIYRNPENPKETDPSKRWRGLPMTAQGFRPNQMYTITAPNGKKHVPPEGRCWSMIESEFIKLKEKGRIYWGKDGNAQPSVIRFLSEVEGLVPWTWWPHDEVGHTDESKKECNSLFGADVSFGTPKPERLLKRVFEIASNPDDLILDSFLGSGTTAAVAHKMNRRYIGIEMGDHAQSHCQARLCKVVDGEQGGISKAVNWQGGGGFRFFKLGEPVFDAYGKLNHDIKFAALAAHIWYAETQTPLSSFPRAARECGSTAPQYMVRDADKPGVTTQRVGTSQLMSLYDSPLLGVYDGTAYYLLYNGILGDRRPQGGNVLTSRVLAELPGIAEHIGPVVIYGESCRLGPSRLAEHHITFKQIPYDVKAL